MSSRKIEISVIVATYNRDESLRETLAALVRQTLEMDRYEVIVVDDGCTDDTSRVVADMGANHPLLNLRYEKHRTNQFKPAACNTGVLLASGKLIAFTDDDIRPVPTWLESHVLRHRIEGGNVCVIGLVLYPEQWERKSNWVRFANDNYRQSATISRSNSGKLPPHRLAGGNFSLPRAAIKRVGMFDKSFVRGEDLEFGWRLFQSNIPLYFEETAVALHHADVILSIDKTLRIFRDYYLNDRILFHKRYPGVNRDFGHWFLESIDWRRDTLIRTLAKSFVRTVAQRPLGCLALGLVKFVDAMHCLYWRPLYQYLMVCEAVDAIRVSNRKQRAQELGNV